MSHSKRAKERRQKRSNLKKSQRSRLSSQHFGDKFVYHGHPIMRGQNKEELIEQEKRQGLDDHLKNFLEGRFGK